MTVRWRQGSWYFRYWHRGRLHERGGFPTKRAAREAEWADRRARGAPGPRGALIPLSAATADYLIQHAERPNYRNLRRALGRFVVFCDGQRRRPSQLASVALADLEAYQTARRASGVRGATVNRDLTYLSAFFSWCVRQRYREDNPVRLVVRDPEPQPARVALSPSQFRTLCQYAPSQREQAKVRLLYLTGLRFGVVLVLRWEQVDLRHRLLRYRSKGKDRTIPLSHRASHVLRALGPRPSGWVFPNRQSETGHDTPYRTIRWWKRAREALGLPTLRRHDLRVSFARALASQGEDLITIRELGGWASLAMVERYVPPYLRQARRAVEKLRG